MLNLLTNKKPKTDNTLLQLPKQMKSTAPGQNNKNQTDKLNKTFVQSPVNKTSVQSPVNTTRFFTNMIDAWLKHEMRNLTKSQALQNMYTKQLQNWDTDKWNEIRKQQLRQMQKVLAGKRKEVRQQFRQSQPTNWESYMNMNTLARTNQSSISPAVQFIYNNLIGLITIAFIPNIAFILMNPLQMAVQKAYPALSKIKQHQLATKLFRDRYEYSSIMTNFILGDKTEKLKLQHLHIPQRPTAVYVWNDVFVINTSDKSPCQYKTQMTIQSKPIFVVFQYDFDVSTRSISNAKIVFGQDQITYNLNDTAKIWEINQNQILKQIIEQMKRSAENITVGQLSQYTQFRRLKKFMIFAYSNFFKVIGGLRALQIIKLSQILSTKDEKQWRQCQPEYLARLMSNQQVSQLITKAYVDLSQPPMTIKLAQLLSLGVQPEVVTKVYNMMADPTTQQQQLAGKAQQIDKQLQKILLAAKGSKMIKK